MSGRPLSFLSLLNDSMAQAVFHWHSFGYVVTDRAGFSRQSAL